MSSGFRKYLKSLSTLEKFQRIVETGRTGGVLYVGGVYGSAASVLAAALTGEIEGTVLLVTPRTKRAESAVDDLGSFFDPADVALFPPPDIYAEEEAPETLNRRLSLLSRFLFDTPPRVIAAPVESVAREVWPRGALEKNLCRIARGEELDLGRLEKWLEERNLRRVPLTEAPGEWSRRGSVLDIFPFSAPLPLRIELFGDAAESIREFNPVTQSSVRELPSCDLIAIKTTRSYRSGGSGPPPTILDYLPPGSAVLFLEPERMEVRVNEIFQKTGDAKLPLAFEKVQTPTPGLGRVFLTQMPRPQGTEGIDFHIHSVDRFSDLAGSFSAFVDALDEKKKRPS
jgi:hypothetical protein